MKHGFLQFLLLFAVMAASVSAERTKESAKEATAGPAGMSEFDASADVLAPDALIGTLLAHNPQLLALEAEWESARQDAVVAGALPDPTFVFGHFVSSVETRTGPQEEKIGLSQKFPWFGKLSTARQAAAREAGAQELLWSAAGEELALRTALAYIDVAHARRALDLIERQIVVTGALQQAAERIYGSAYNRSTGQEDILRFSVLANRMRDRAIALRENEQLALDRIERLLDGEIVRKAKFSITAALQAERPVPPDPPARFARAYELRPEIMAAELRLDASQLRTRLAKLDYYPDITLGVDYTVVGEANAMNGIRPSDSSKDAAMVYFSLNLPLWWDKQDAQLRSARQNFINALDAENTVLDLQLSEVDAQAKAARAQWKLFRALGMAALTRNSPNLRLNAP